MKSLGRPLALRGRNRFDFHSPFDTPLELGRLGSNSTMPAITAIVAGFSQIGTL